MAFSSLSDLRWAQLAGFKKPCPAVVRGDGDDPAAAVRGDPYRTGHRCTAGHRVGFNVFFFLGWIFVEFFFSIGGAMKKERNLDAHRNCIFS